MTSALRFFVAWLLLAITYWTARFGWKATVSLACAGVVSAILGKLTMKAIRHFWSK